MTIMNMVGGGGSGEHGYSLYNGNMGYYVPFMCVTLTGNIPIDRTNNFYVGGVTVGVHTSAICAFKGPVIENDWIGFNTKGTMRKVLITNQYYNDNYRGHINSIKSVTPTLYITNSSSNTSNPIEWRLDYPKYQISGTWVCASTYAKYSGSYSEHNMPFQLTSDGSAFETFQGTFTYDGSNYSFSGEFPYTVFCNKTDSSNGNVTVVPVDCEITELE